MKHKNHIWLAVGLPLMALLIAPSITAAAVEGHSAPGESNLGFLRAGLLIAWGGFFTYAFYLSRKTREMRREINELREQLAQKVNSNK